MKTQTTHTPGPWTFTMLEEYGKPRFTAAVVGDNSQLAEVRFAFLMHPAECNANARLIAAAPDLLEACKMLSKRLAYYTSDLETCDLPDGDHEAATKAEAAINKASQ